MQVGELTGLSVDKSEKYCKKKNETHKDWKSRVAGYVGKGDGEPTGTRLYEELKDHKREAGGRYVAKYPGRKWQLHHITKTAFPSQAHHLIPKKFLPTHIVSAFLAKKYTKHPKYVLARDSYYDTDNFKNGYCMPYSSPLAEWTTAGRQPAHLRGVHKLVVSFEVMDFSGRQLHQGSHREEGYVYPDPDSPDEEEDIETPGYLGMAKNLLNAVASRAESHFAECEVCEEEKSGGKKKLQPLASIITHVDNCSAIMMGLIKTNTIFVSKVAGEYAVTKGLFKSIKRLTKSDLV